MGEGGCGQGETYPSDHQPRVDCVKVRVGISETGGHVLEPELDIVGQPLVNLKRRDIHSLAVLLACPP